MELIRKENEFNIPGYPEHTLIKVRPNDGDYDYYLFPVSDVERVIELLKQSGIDHDVIRTDDRAFNMIPIGESGYDIEGLDRSQVVALYTAVDISDLLLLIDHINNNEDSFKVVLYKNSELPEYAELLCREKTEALPAEVREALKEYMKYVLDMKAGDLASHVLDYSERASYGMLLNLYSKAVQDYVLDHVSARHAEEIRADIIKQAD